MASIDRGGIRLNRGEIIAAAGIGALVSLFPKSTQAQSPDYLYDTLGSEINYYSEAAASTQTLANGDTQITESLKKGDIIIANSAVFGIGSSRYLISTSAPDQSQAISILAEEDVDATFIIPGGRDIGYWTGRARSLSTNSDPNAELAAQKNDAITAAQVQVRRGMMPGGCGLVGGCNGVRMVSFGVRKSGYEVLSDQQYSQASAASLPDVYPQSLEFNGVASTNNTRQGGTIQYGLYLQTNGIFVIQSQKLGLGGSVFTVDPANNPDSTMVFAILARSDVPNFGITTFTEGQMYNWREIDRITDNHVFSASALAIRAGQVQTMRVFESLPAGKSERVNLKVFETSDGQFFNQTVDAVYQSGSVLPAEDRYKVRLPFIVSSAKGGW